MALMAGTDYYIPAAALGLAFVAKAPGLRRGWRDPMVVAICTLIGAAASGFFFAAPPTVAMINGWTGIANISAPLVYCILTAFSCASIVLIITWRGGPPVELRRTIRLWVLGYAAVVVCTIALFLLGDAPSERLQDFDTYYAETPFIREMIALYLAEHMVAAAIICVMCWRWANVVRSWLRGALWVLVAGFAFNLSFGCLKLAAVVGRWAGYDLDVLSTSLAPPFAAVGAILSTVGFLLPLVGGRGADTWYAWRTYRLLGSLAHALEEADPKKTAELKLPLLAGPQRRLISRESRIYDRLHDLSPWMQDSEDEADAAKTAQMIAEAIHLRAQGAPAVSDEVFMPMMRAADPDHLARVSQAYAVQH
ncbi:MAB_1171c family putative transporter [Streptomyces sp. NPDC091201]|uniref:MAB_1171c family putative transporter n=1 Tax=Streptomyces sp. NPDC091201 TaxID=3155190 RepID=UPI0034223F32